jgi:hypothetical protein
VFQLLFAGTPVARELHSKLLPYHTRTDTVDANRALPEAFHVMFVLHPAACTHVTGAELTAESSGLVHVSAPELTTNGALEQVTRASAKLDISR